MFFPGKLGKGGWPSPLGRERNISFEVMTLSLSSVASNNTQEFTIDTVVFYFTIQSGFPLILDVLAPKTGLVLYRHLL